MCTPSSADLPQEMSATSGYLSTTELELSMSGKTLVAIPNSSATEIVQSGDIECGQHRSPGMVFSVMSDQAVSETDGFSSDSDYAGLSDCDDGELEACDKKRALSEQQQQQQRMTRKRKVAARRMACGAQNDPVVSRNVKTMSLATTEDEEEEEEDVDDYVDIHPVDLSTRLAAEEKTYSPITPWYARNHATHSAPSSEKNSDAERTAPRGVGSVSSATAVTEEDDYEDMAPQHDVYATAAGTTGFAALPLSDYYAGVRGSHFVSSPSQPSFRQFSKQGSLPSATTVSSAAESFCSASDSCCTSSSADSRAHAVATTATAAQRTSMAERSPVGAPRRFSVMVGQTRASLGSSGSSVGCAGAGAAEEHDVDDGDRDYTNVHGRDEMPVQDVWLERKQNLHDYEDPDYDQARHTDEEEEDEDGVEEISKQVYEPGVYNPTTPTGYQSYAGFHNIEVTSEPENSRYAISPPIAHKLTRKNSEGSLFKLSTLPPTSSTPEKRKSKRSSLILGLSSRPQSRNDSLSVAGTPIYSRPHEIIAEPASSTMAQKAVNKGRSTPTLRSRFSSFSIRERFGNSANASRPLSSLSFSQLGTASRHQFDEPALLHQQSCPAGRSVHYAEASVCSADTTQQGSSSSSSSPSLNRRSEYDSIASQWTSLDGRPPPKGKQSRSPFSLLSKKKKAAGKKKDKEMAACVSEEPELDMADNSTSITSLAKSTLV